MEKRTSNRDKAERAIAKTVTDGELDYDHIIPEMMNKQLQKNITLALSKFTPK